MPAIYLNCAGSSNVNGIYDFQSTGPTTGYFRQRGSFGPNYLDIIYSTDRWIVQDLVDQYYALITDNSTDSGAVSSTGWITVGGGDAPAPQSYYYSNGICGALEVSSSVNLNGLYIYDAGYYIHTTNNNYVIGILSYEEDAGIEYSIWGLSDNSIPNTIGMLVTINGEPPIGEFMDGYPQSGVAIVNFSEACEFLNCSGGGNGGGEVISSGIYLYKNNNNFYIRGLNNNYFLRKT